MRVLLSFGHDADWDKVNRFLSQLKEKHPNAVVVYVRDEVNDDGTSLEELACAYANLCSVQYNVNVSLGADAWSAAFLRAVVEGNPEMALAFGQERPELASACQSWAIPVHRR